MHASTFGGNPIAAAAGIAMIETIEEEGLLERSRQVVSDLPSTCQDWSTVARTSGGAGRSG